MTENEVVEEREDIVPPSLIYANPTTPAGRRTKIVHNILVVLGETPDDVKGSLEALGCTSPEPVTQLLIRLGFRSIMATALEIQMDDLMTGERFWIMTPPGINAFWQSKGLAGEPVVDNPEH